MAWLGVAAALVLIGIVLIDAFEALMLPRRVRHAFRLARLYYRTTWLLWLALARLLPGRRRRHTFLSVFGPISLFGLLCVWAAGLIVGFGLLHWSLGTGLNVTTGAEAGLGTFVYFSGTTFFTLGYGDMVPTEGLGRFLSVTEAGLGFGFLAVVIGYLPVLYQAFSRREITISLLDARAGSPPSAGELFRRLANLRTHVSLDSLLAEWERWAAELLESHLSFPVLRYYRSQHDNQSWVATLTMILDTSSLLIASGDGHPARLTFAMARHAAVDLCLIVQLPPASLTANRLSTADITRLRDWLASAGLNPRDEPTMTRTLTELRGLYEPFVYSLAQDLVLTLPPFLQAEPPVDNWQTSPGMRRSPDLNNLQAMAAEDEHAS
jgi:hypothetical protein